MNRWILTASGVEFDLVDPQPDMVVIDDIALSLSRLQRFNGHTRVNANVALHSVMVSYAVGDPDLVRQALLHDAVEAYTGDISTPVKVELGPELQIIQRKIEAAIAERFDVDFNIGRSVVKLADIKCLNYERREFMPDSKPWGLEDYGIFEPSLWMRKYYYMDYLASEKLFINRFTDIF